MCYEFWRLVVGANNFDLQLVHDFLIAQVLDHAFWCVLLEYIAVDRIEV